MFSLPVLFLLLALEETCILNIQMHLCQTVQIVQEYAPSGFL